MITKRERRYAIALLIKMVADKGIDHWDVGVLCMMALGVTGSDIEDAVENFENPTADWNPFIAMMELANKDEVVVRRGGQVAINYPKGNLN